MIMIVKIILAISIFLAISTAFFKFLQIRKRKVDNKQAAEIASYIRAGALAFLSKEYNILIIFVIIIFLFLILSPIGWKIAVAFLGGAFLSALAGNIGMRVATISNVRTALAVKNKISKGFKIAFSAGSVTALLIVSLGLLGVTLLYFIFKDPKIIYGFGLGASLIALFARVGGGIYTKAADIGADIVGKVEESIPEDDPRNPAVIADNVGDNVGDVAGMGADLFESYVDSIIAAMVLGANTFLLSGRIRVLFPLLLAAIGILSSLIGIFITLFLVKRMRPANALNIGVFTSALIMIIGTTLIIKYIPEGLSFNLFYAVLFGLIAGIIIGLITEFYTSSSYKPTRAVSRSSQFGAATNIISGLALGMQSTIVPIIIVCLAIFFSYKFAGLYGVAISAVGMLSTLGITLAADTYGPVVDNAAGISEMAHLGKEIRERCEKLDAIGNTTAAIGKGFAIGSAALTALVLSVSYSRLVGLKFLNLNSPYVLIGLFLGGLLPFLFSSFVMKSVGRAADFVVKEVRRQFRETRGLLTGRVKPNYNKTIKIITGTSLKQMLLPTLMAILSPIAVGFLLGKEALGGFLVGSIVTGFPLAITMANSGGAWDNAKKYIEAGNFGGEGSLAHKAAVIGDTVGDPFKDAAGPSLNILIKLVSIIALIIAPLL